MGYYEYLGKEVKVVIDRPIGSKHPDYELIYPINYGYIPDSKAGDGEEIDAYLVGIDEPLEKYCGIVKALVIREDDVENKLVVIPDHLEVDERMIAEAIQFQESYFKTRIILNQKIIGNSLILRPLNKVDPLMIQEAFADQGWTKPASQYEQYLAWQEEGLRDIIVAQFNKEFAGYLTIQWQSENQTFANAKIPEIVDFNVLKKFQRKGIGSVLMDEAESRIGQVSEISGIGVGVTADYGPAHVLYIKRGYIPDGKGIKENNKPLSFGDQISIHDGIVIHLTKNLK